MKATFLKAEWRKLIMANYAVDSKILQSYLPPKTEIDLWNNKKLNEVIANLYPNVLAHVNETKEFKKRNGIK